MSTALEGSPTDRSHFNSEGEYVGRPDPRPANNLLRTQLGAGGVTVGSLLEKGLDEPHIPGGEKHDDSVKISNGSEIRRIPQTIRVQELLERRKIPVSGGWIVKFHELPKDLSAYNASDIFMMGEVPHMLVRVEGSRADQEFTSRLTIWRCSLDGRECWPITNKISNLPELTKDKIAQDPSIAYVEGKHGAEGMHGEAGKWVISWVEVMLIDPSDPTKGRTYKSVTYTGDSLDNLKHLVDSPENTKGVHYARLLDGRIGISTRPDIDGNRKVCFTIANSWTDVTTELLASAKEVEGLSVEEAWLGVNGMKTMSNGDVSMVGHLGRYVKSDIPDNREYDGIHFVLTPPSANNPDDPAVANYLEIIARADDLKISPVDAPPKRHNLAHILYTSWLRIARKRGGDAIWMGGFRDRYEAGISVPDPLEEWRNDHPEYADDPFQQSTTDLALSA